jgi:HTH-type transcriptional regulator/antitoxin HipB
MLPRSAAWTSHRHPCAPCTRSRLGVQPGLQPQQGPALRRARNASVGERKACTISRTRHSPCGVSTTAESTDAGTAEYRRCDNAPMTKGKRISAEIGEDALQSIRELGAAARLARTTAGEGQAAAAARLGVHVQTIGRIEAGEPGVAVGHVLGMLALYGIGVELQQRKGA